MICNFSSSISTDALYRENAASPSVWIGRLRCASTDTEGLRMIVISFAPVCFPKNALGNSHTAFKGDIWCAITISMQPSVTDASGANRKPPPSYGRFIKATKRVFSNICFLPSGSVTVNLSAGLFSDGQGQLLRNLVYPALFYSAAFSIVTRTLHDRLLRRTPSLRLQ